MDAVLEEILRSTTLPWQVITARLMLATCLGGVLGFQSKGIIGWIVRLILVRWGWGFLQSILRRIFLGR